MMRTRSRSTIVLGATVIGALALGACGSDSNDSGSSSASGSSGSKSAPASTVVVEDTDLGNILADGKDRTLYLFLKDQGTTSECSGDCAVDWPPLTVSGSPTAGSGADQSLLGTTMRSDGKTQVTYNGHPVYRFEGDQNPGDTAGQGLTAFGAAWYVLSPTGDEVTASSGSGHSGSGSSSSANSGSGSSSNSGNSGSGSSGNSGSGSSAGSGGY